MYPLAILLITISVISFTVGHFYFVRPYFCMNMYDV